MFEVKPFILFLVNACFLVHSSATIGNCPRFTRVKHGNLRWSQDNSSVTVVCDKNFTLVGSASIHCTEFGHWNDTLPQCMAKVMEHLVPCHFERASHRYDPLFWDCHWISTDSVDYTWIEYTTEDSSFQKQQFLPPHDYTTNSSSGTSLILMRRTLKERKEANNNTSRVAKFISPLLPATAPTNEQLCLKFYYYVGRDDPSVGLEVWINETVVWQNILEKKNRGPPYAANVIKSQWTRHMIDLRNQIKEFRVTLAAQYIPYKPMREIPGIAIDDVGLYLGEENCSFNTAANEFERKPITTVHSTTQSTTLVRTIQTPVDESPIAVISSELFKSIQTTEAIVARTVTNRTAVDLLSRITNTSTTSVVTSSPILQTTVDGTKKNETSPVMTVNTAANTTTMGSNSSKAMPTSVTAPKAEDKEQPYGAIFLFAILLYLLISLIGLLFIAQLSRTYKYYEVLPNGGENSLSEMNSGVV